jgi:hypothetical protein
MKAVITYLLMFFIYLAGAHANGKVISSHHSTQSVLKLDQVGGDNLPDIEDDNDDENSAKKISIPAKWLSAIAGFSIDIEKTYQPQVTNIAHRGSSGDTFIALRVLRI